MISIIALSSQAHALSCISLFGKNNGNWAYFYDDIPRPELPENARILVESEHYVIFETRYGTQILFDVRYAETNSVTREKNEFGSSHTIALVNSLSGKVFVKEGRHRAIEASQGFVISERLGGTQQPFWLRYVSAVEEVWRFRGGKPLSEFEIPWSPGEF